MQVNAADRLRLYLVADPDLCRGDFLATIRGALRGGVTAVQLRVKRGADGPFLALADDVLAVCREHGALFLVNDRLDIALAAGADGVHLGVDDLPTARARALGGSAFLVGYSPEDDAGAVSARNLGVDYLGVGPVYGTASKSDAGAAIGLDTLTRRGAISGLPIVGIGGIGAANAAPVIEAGAVGVAVVSAILGAADPEQAARELRSIVDAADAPTR